MKKFFENYSVILWIFLIGSFVGFIWENIWTIIKGSYHLRQGLIYEPLIPIYGFGALLFYYVYNKAEIKTQNKLLQIITIFFIGLFVGGVAEYACSFVQEQCFGTISWNYTHLRFNLNGRTSLLHCTFWGIMGVAFYKLCLPLFNNLKNVVSNNYIKIFTLFYSFILIFDSSISIMACLRQKERREEIAATNVLEVFLDSHYNDEYLNVIFNNARQTKR